MFHIEVNLFATYKTTAIIVVYLFDAENILILIYGQQVNEKVIVEYERDAIRAHTSACI